MKGIAHREGSKGLFRGNLATVARILLLFYLFPFLVYISFDITLLFFCLTVVGIFPYAAIQFVTYETTTKVLLLKIYYT